MTTEDLPPSAFVLARYDDIYNPCGGIEEYIGGWVCRTRIAEVRTRNKTSAFRLPRSAFDRALRGGIRCENLTADEAAVLRKFFPTGYGDFPNEEACRTRIAEGGRRNEP